MPGIIETKNNNFQLMLENDFVWLAWLKQILAYNSDGKAERKKNDSEGKRRRDREKEYPSQNR